MCKYRVKLFTSVVRMYLTHFFVGFLEFSSFVERSEFCTNKGYNFTAMMEMCSISRFAFQCVFFRGLNFPVLGGLSFLRLRSKKRFVPRDDSGRGVRHCAIKRYNISPH